MSDPISAGLVVGAAGQVGKAALDAQKAKNQKVNDALLEQAKGTPEFNKAVEAYGRRQAMKQVILTGLFDKVLQRFHISASYFQEDFQRDLTAKTEHIPSDELQEPKLSVAAPAIQGLAWSLEEPDLKELYLNLLATASDGRVAISAHPSFVEVIKQLSAEEAVLLAPLLAREAIPVVRIIRRVLENQAFNLLQNHVINWRKDGAIASPPFGATFVDNWVRLGLISVKYDEWLTSEGVYAWADDRPELLLTKTLMGVKETEAIEAEKGIIRRTSFGAQFAAAAGLNNSVSPYSI